MKPLNWEKRRRRWAKKTGGGESRADLGGDVISSSAGIAFRTKVGIGRAFT